MIMIILIQGELRMTMIMIDNEETLTIMILLNWDFDQRWRCVGVVMGNDGDKCFRKWGTGHFDFQRTIHCERIKAFQLCEPPELEFGLNHRFFLVETLLKCAFVRVLNKGSEWALSFPVLHLTTWHTRNLHGTTRDALHNFTGEHVIWVARDEIAYMRQHDVWKCKLDVYISYISSLDIALECVFLARVTLQDKMTKKILLAWHHFTRCATWVPRYVAWPYRSGTLRS